MNDQHVQREFSALHAFGIDHTFLIINGIFLGNRMEYFAVIRQIDGPCDAHNFFNIITCGSFARVKNRDIALTHYTFNMPSGNRQINLPDIQSSALFRCMDRCSHTLHDCLKIQDDSFSDTA